VGLGNQTLYITNDSASPSSQAFRPRREDLEDPAKQREGRANWERGRANGTTQQLIKQALTTKELVKIAPTRKNEVTEWLQKRTFTFPGCSHVEEREEPWKGELEPGKKDEREKQNKGANDPRQDSKEGPRKSIHVKT